MFEANLNLDSLFQDFISEMRYAGKKSEETLRGYKASFNLFVKLNPDVSIYNLNKDMVLNFLEKLETRKRIVGRGQVKKGVRASTVSTYRAKLSKFFDWLVINNHLEKNPFEGIAKPKVKYTDIRYLKSKDIEKILGAIQNGMNWNSSFIARRNDAIVKTFLFTGIRRGELLGIRTCDVDLDSGFIRIKRDTSKTRKEREMPINTQLRLSLESYIKERQGRGYTSEFFFTSDKYDGPLTRSGLKHLTDKLNKYTGIHFHVHQFRHTFAMNLLKQGVNLVEIKELMGHEDIRHTAVYLRGYGTKNSVQTVEKLTIGKWLD